MNEKTAIGAIDGILNACSPQVRSKVLANYGFAPKAKANRLSVKAAKQVLKIYLVG